MERISDLDRALERLENQYRTGAKYADNMAQLMLDNTNLRAANAALAMTLSWAGECLDKAKFDTCAKRCREAVDRYGGK